MLGLLGTKWPIAMQKKRALDGNKVAENMNYSVNELMSMAIPKLKEHWQNDWDRINRKWHYKIKPRVDKSGPTTNRPRTTRILTKLQTGWSHCLGAVRFKLGINSSPNCGTCGVPGDVEHYLINCSKFGYLRNEMMSLA